MRWFSVRTFMLILWVWSIVSAACGAQVLQPFPQIIPGGTFYGTTTPNQIADFDNNGMADIVGMYSTAPLTLSLGIVLNPGTSPMAGFSTITPAVAIPPGPTGATGTIKGIGDFDGDGHRDVLISVLVIVGQSGGSEIQLLAGDGSGGFGAPTSYVAPIINSQLTGKDSVLDFNGDGVMDFLRFRSFPSAGFDVYFGGPTGGTLSHSQSLVGTTSFRPSLVGDFDGNGCDDLLYTDSGSPSGWMLARGGAGPTFPTIQPMVFPIPITSITPLFVGDFDGDGASDLVMVNNPSTPSATIYIAFGDPTASMAATITIVPPTIPPGFTSFHLLGSPVHDIDADGRDDLMFRFANISLTFARVALGAFRGIGNRSVSPTATVLWTAPMSTGTNGIAGTEVFQDFDGDGDVDVFFVDLSNVNSAPPYEISYFENLARFGDGSPGTSGIPVADVGAAYPGNAAFALEVSNALPLAPAICGIGVAIAQTSGSGVLLEMNSGSLLSPSGSFGFTFTDMSGRAVLAAPIPPIAALAGFSIYSQWAILDPQGSFISANAPFALSGGRALTIF